MEIVKENQDLHMVNYEKYTALSGAYSAEYSDVHSYVNIGFI